MQRVNWEAQQLKLEREVAALREVTQQDAAARRQLEAAKQAAEVGGERGWDARFLCLPSSAHCTALLCLVFIFTAPGSSSGTCPLPFTV